MKYIKFFAIASYPIVLLITVFIKSDQLPGLDALAVHFNTDKSSNWHNYTEVYKRYFDSIRFTVSNFLEIGFYRGSSAHMWEHFFINASLHFIDNNPEAFQSFGQGFTPRSKFHVVDQSKTEALVKFAKSVGVEFDIIIDDGSHIITDQIVSFNALFPSLKSGGYYVIEDMHTSYWKEYGGIGAKNNPKASIESAIRYFQAKVDDVNYVGAYTGCADFKKKSDNLQRKLSYFQQNIQSLHFYDSICIIIKR